MLFKCGSVQTRNEVFGRELRRPEEEEEKAEK
jgi:hypothetical protein